MEPTFITGLPLWAINLFLAGLVFFRSPRNPSNQAFAVFVLTVIGWSFCVKMLYVTMSNPPGLLWGRLPFAAASLIGSSFAVFCQIFPDLKRLSLNRGSQFFILLGTLTAGLSLTPLVLRDMSISSAGRLQADYGPLYPVFGAFMLAAFGHGIWTLTRKWRSARGRSRLQVQYLCLGFCIALCGGTTTNLIIPAAVGSSSLSTYGPYFSVFLIGLTAHAIIRHRLLDIRVVVRQTVTYGLSAIAAAGILWGVFVLAQGTIGFQLSLSSVALVMAILGTVIFHPIRATIQRFLDKYGYREVYDYRQAIRTVSQMLAGLLRVDPLCEQLTAFIFSTLKVEEAAVYLCRDQPLLDRRSHLNASEDRRVQAKAVIAASPRIMKILLLLTRAGEPTLRDEIGRWVEEREVEDIAQEFTNLHSEVIAPLLVEGRVAGFITVGVKLSGDPFFQPDIELLTTIGHQAGTALKRAQLYEEVTWMKEYSESILRHMESGVMAASHDGLLTVINDSGARLIGVATTAVIGSPITGLIACGLGGPLLDTLTGKTTYTDHEATLLTAAGRSLPIVLSTSILQGRVEEQSGAILVFNDLSRIKTLEEENRRIERLASIGAFMSGIAHEIKNPLVAIKTLAELLPEQYTDEEFRDTFTQVTLHEVDRIDALLRRLRSFSSGFTEPLRPTSIIGPLEETLTLLAGELIKRKIKVTHEYQHTLPTIMADPDQLKQVFVNVCMNALEAMGEGGTLTITVGSDGRRKGEVTQLIVQISDTGPGIPAHHLSTIFEPFFTLKEKGTGLGLAICRGIIDYHRGSIAATNRSDGPGATFTLTLPVVQGEEGHAVTTPGC